MQSATCPPAGLDEASLVQTTVVSELASILLANGSRFALRIEGVHNADSASATPMHMPSTVDKITGRLWPRPQR